MGLDVSAAQGDVNRWQSLLMLGDRLITAKNIYSQVGIIQNHFSAAGAAQVNILLLEDFKPLPHSISDQGEAIPEGLKFITRSQLDEIPVS